MSISAAIAVNYRGLYDKCAPMTLTLYNGKEHRLGTGVLIDETHVLTVGHLIVHSSDTLKAYGYPDRLESNATVLGVDHSEDLAILTLDHSISESKKAKIATKNAETGDSVLIIGSGAGFAWTATQGIVSGVNRLHERFGQTDAVVNPGNSGGPVFDVHGRVIGIVDAKIVDPFEGVDGIGFFIPADQINAFVGKYTLK